MASSTNYLRVKIWNHVFDHVELLVWLLQRMKRLVKIVHVKVIWIDREIKSNYETENVCKLRKETLGRVT